jgi:hypothetical protein
MKHKLPPGRPITGAEKKLRYQVALEPRVADEMRSDGGDNLSRGIAMHQAVNARLRSITLVYQAALRELAAGSNAADMRKVALKALNAADEIRELSYFGPSEDLTKREPPYRNAL